MVSTTTKKQTEMTPPITIILLIIGLASVLIYLNKDRWKRNVKRYETELLFYQFGTLEFDFEELLFDYKNRVYITDEYAAELAREHCFYMMGKGVKSHDNYDDRENALTNLGAKRVAEIVTIDRNVEDAFQSFLDSPDHRPTIDDPNYNAVGIGITQQGSKLFFTIIFFEV